MFDARFSFPAVDCAEFRATPPAPGATALKNAEGFHTGRASHRRRNAKMPAVFLLILPLALGLTACGVSLSVTPTPTPAPTTPDTRADALLAQMTQAQKLQLVQGSGDATMPRGGAGYIAGIQPLGIPALYFGDGSVGVGNSIGPATALPSSIASAASWDTSEATKYGTIIGSELSDYGINVNLGGNITSSAANRAMAAPLRPRAKTPSWRAKSQPRI
jgi:hypothetical protein